MLEIVISGARVLSTVTVVGSVIRIVMNLDDDLGEVLQEHRNEIVVAIEDFAWRLFGDSDVERDFISNTSDFIVRYSARNS